MATTVMSLTVVAAEFVKAERLNPSSAQLVLAQQVRVTSPQDAWQRVYQRLPNFPKENQYISVKTGQVDPNSTLASRLIRYHFYGKGRPANYRLDWKLTLADYLGANELMNESTYPGYDTLRTNPMEGDRAAIKRLNRKQREALVQTLVSIFQPNTANTGPQPAASTPQPVPSPKPTFRSSGTSQPQPGGADLLK